MQGKLIGERYRILERLGEGGMAVVYIARDEKLGRKVAIKILHQHFAENEDVRSRFVMEATAVSTMDHPNILNVYDYSGPDSDQLWIVTELLHGQTLSQFAKSFRNSCVNPIVACFIVREILKALDHAHGKDIVHRDIKPDNVMVLKNGRVILMDFGIAKNMHKSSMTMTGTFMGSPSYMSPEQVRGKNVDARSDVYSLGILFYEITAGRLPYTGDSTHAVILKIMEGKFTAPRFLVPAFPEEIDHIVCHAMHKSPKNRFQSSQSFGEQIDLFIQKIGFVESHVELERYASSPSQYMQQLVKMTKQSIKVGTIKATAYAKTTRNRQLTQRETIAQQNQNSILQPVAFNADHTRMVTPGHSAPRKDRAIPQKPVARRKTTVHVKASPKKSHTRVHQGNTPAKPKVRKKRIRPAVPKLTKPVAIKMNFSNRKNIHGDSPLLGMFILLFSFLALGWGFYELVVKPYRPTRQNIAPRPPKRIVKKQRKASQPKPVIKRETPTTIKKVRPEQTVTRRAKNTSRRETIEKQIPPTTVKAQESKRLHSNVVSTTLPKPIPVEERQQNQKKAEEVAKEKQVAKKATLIISANAAARIFINGRPRGTTVDDTYHSRPIELDPGKYKITLKNRAYEDLTIFKTLKKGQKLYVDDLVLKKKAIKVPITVNVNQFPTRMTLRGKGNSTYIRRDILQPNQRILLEPGSYSLQVRHKGKTINREVKIDESSKGLTINLDFSRR